MKKVYLLGRLKGGALAWSQSMDEELLVMDYEEVEAALKAHFEGEVTSHVRKLQRFRQGSLELEAFNAKFSTLAAAAARHTTERERKDLYLTALTSSTTRSALATHMNLTLQQLMARAADLAFINSAATPSARGATAPAGERKQNPYRVQCPKCNKWHNPSKGETCLCPDKQRKGGQGSQPGGKPRPRVNEATLHEDCCDHAEVAQHHHSDSEASDAGSESASF